MVVYKRISQRETEAEIFKNLKQGPSKLQKLDSTYFFRLKTHIDRSTKFVNMPFLKNIEEEKLKAMNKKYCRPKYCLNIVAHKVNSKIWNKIS